MKTLSVVNAAFCTVNILLFLALPSSFGKPEVVFIGVVFALWCLVFAIYSLVHHWKKEA